WGKFVVGARNRKRAFVSHVPSRKRTEGNEIFRRNSLYCSMLQRFVSLSLGHPLPPRKPLRMFLRMSFYGLRLWHCAVSFLSVQLPKSLSGNPGGWPQKARKHKDL